ncbi:MAG: LemA family protein [Clostridia bacterium]|nr:LemA family protein [Deltaproteobacteria bacterium]
MHCSIRTATGPLILAKLLAVLVFASNLPACGFNEVVQRDEDVKAAWAEVENQYKRRADLVPNLVNTVKGAANFEQETLTKVIEARAKATSIQVDGSTIDDPAKLQAFEKAQSQLGGALSRLLVVAEKYPELRATEAFRDLQAQLEGTENRIAVARRRFIDSVAAYNTTIQTFPSMIGAKMRGKQVRPTFTGNPADATAPEVKF